MIHYQDRWAVVTGASSGLGRGLAARLADRGMSLVLTGRNAARLDEAAHEIRRAAPRVKVETVAADLSTGRVSLRCSLTSATARSRCWSTTPASAATARLSRPTVTARPTRWPSTSVPSSPWLGRSCPEWSLGAAAGFSTSRPRLRSSPGLTRRCTGRARHSCSRSARRYGLRPARLAWRSPHCVPVPPAPGFVEALGADVGHTAIYSRLGEPEPVIDAGLRALDKGRAVVIPGVRNRVVATERPIHAARVAHAGVRPAAAASQRAPAADRGSQRDRGPRLGRAGVGSADRRRTLAVLVSGLPMGPRRVTSRCRAAARLLVEGAPGRTAQHRGDGRSTPRACHSRGCRGAARGAHVHAPPHARRPWHRRGQR